jgi:hypothetical protein
VVLCVLALWLAGVFSPSGGARHQGARPAASARTQPPTSTLPPPVPGIPTSTLIATVNQTTPAFNAPSGPQVGTVPATWYGAPTTLPVVSQADGWLLVRVTPPPNGQVSWISSNAVNLVQTGYYITVNLTSMRLYLYNQGRLSMDAPVDIGSPQSPTPTGNFFVAFFAQAPNPNYGAFVIVTSAMSSAISDWEQSGQSLITIHGTVADDAAIGIAGAAGSRGALEMHAPDLAALRTVPAGTPIVIMN